MFDVRDYGAVADDPDVDLAEAFRAIFDVLDATGSTGACILVPTGQWTLKTPVRIRHDFITITGLGAGFQTGTNNGGGSWVRVEAEDGFLVERGATPGPRVRGLVFQDLLLDGIVAAAGRTGIRVEQDSDGLVVRDLSAKEFGSAVVIRAADAASITGCLIAENDSCIRLTIAGIACVVANNRLGAKPAGITLFVENHDRIVISGNSLFPDGYANVVLKSVRYATVTGNQLQNYSVPMLFLEGACEGNAIVGNQLFAQRRPGSNRFNDNDVVPFSDDFGLIRVEGDDNVISGLVIRTEGPREHVPIVMTGEGNRLADFEIIADEFLDTEVALEGGTLGRENVVLGTRRPESVAIEPGVWAIVQGLPGAIAG